jgi:hypothetical protein
VNSVWQIYSIVVHLSFYGYKILLPQYTLLTDCHRLLLHLKLHTSNFMVIILITLCRVCLVLNTFLTHGTHDNTNLIRKLLFASLQAIVTHIKVISAFIPLVKKKKTFILRHVMFDESFFFPIKILWTQALHLPSLISTTFLVHGYLTLTILYKNSASSIVHVMHNPSSTNATLYSKLKVYIWCSSTPSRWKSS